MTYACHNHPPRDYKRFLPVQCGHVGALDDPRCAGCRWRVEACPHPVTVALDSVNQRLCVDCKSYLKCKD